MFATKLCAECLFDISQLQSDSVSALYWSKIATTIKDSIINRKAIKKAAQLEIELEYRDLKINDEKEILALQRKTEELEQNKITNLLLFFTIIPITLGLLWWYGSGKVKTAIGQEQNNSLEEAPKHKVLNKKESTELSQQEKQIAEKDQIWIAKIAK